jgi:photosystem II stability/assembly factor-like uncharacterized protein
MKTFFLFTVLLLIFTVKTQCQWKWVHPQPCGSPVMSMKATDSLHVWMAAAGGTIIYTRDGGKKWETFQSDLNEAIFSVSFVDSLRGWASAEHGAVYRTTDGGKHWSRQTLYDLSLGEICFADSLHGWIGSQYYANMLYTTDGGITWDTVNTGFNEALYILSFADSRHGWAGGFGSLIAHTSDGGLTWNQQAHLPSYLSTLCFPDSLNGFALTFEDMKIRYTNDGGATWVMRNPPGFYQESMYFCDKDHGWSTGFVDSLPPVYNKGRIATTTDGGKTFHNPFTITGRSIITNVTASDSLHAWATGDGGMVFNLTSVHFFNADHGIAVGEASQILETTDGGENWNRVPTSVLGSFTDLFFQSPTHGWITARGIIIETKDGGISWDTNFVTNSNINLLRVAFSDSLHGWAVGWGDNGLGSYSHMFRTRNDGKTWGVSDFSVSSLNSVSFPDSLHGWMCGDNGDILKTKDGGATWEEFIYDQYVYFNSVQFMDSLHGWVVGDASSFYGGIALYTDDGGETWIRKDAGVGRPLRSVFFTDLDFGYVTGDEGAILRWGENSVGIESHNPPAPGLNLSNYPNPFRDLTTITYTLAVPSDVSLTVYNTLGTKIASLVENTESAGIHHVTFNSGFLSTGIYICRLKATNTTQTIKIVKW